MKIRNIKARLVSLALALCMMIPAMQLAPLVSHAEVEPSNWVNDDETARYWPIPNQGRIIKVSPAEPVKNPSLRYIGGYTRPDGREVVRLAFSAYSGSVSDVWQRMILKPDDNLNKLIDWEKSGMGEKRPEQFVNNHDGYNFNENFIKFKPLSAQQGGSGNLHVMDLGDSGTKTVRTGLLGVHYETPIDLVLKEGQTVKTLTKNPLIQMRLTDDNYERIYSTTISSNQEIPYSSYTMSTFVPVRVDLKQGIINTDVVRNYENTMQAASSYIKYNEEKGYFDVYTRRTQGTVGSVADGGGSMNSGSSENKGDYGFMQSFDESLIDILKPQDESGTVAQIFTTDDNDNLNYPSDDPTVPLPANRIDYALKDIVKKDGVGTIEVSNNDPGSTFMRVGPTLTTYGTSTVVRYFVDKDKLREKFGSSDLVSYEFFSSVFATNKTGVEEFKSKPRDEDINLKRGDTIDIRFDGRRDLITLGTFDTQGSVIQIGDDQYKISLRTTTDKAKYVGGGITWDKDYMRKMTVWVPFDIKIKKDTPITIFSRKTKSQEVSPGMTVTFNYSAKNDEGGNITKSKTYRFEREFKDPSYSMNDKGEVFKDGKKVNDPQNTLFKDNHLPLMYARQANFGGGILARTADTPDVNEVFTDSKYLAGRTKFDSAKVYLYQEEKSKDKAPARIGELVASNDKKEMMVNGEKVEGFEWQSKEKPDAKDPAAKIIQDLWKVKDTPLYFTNQDVLANALENENSVVEQVQAKVTFNLNGGKMPTTVKSFKGFDDKKLIGTEFAYKTQRNSANEEVVRIAPMNKKFATDPAYKANGFEGEDVSLKDHNGEDLKGDALELRKFVAEEPTVDAKVFLGWTTQPLKGTSQKVTEEFAKLKEATTADEVNSDKNYIFTKTSPVTKETTVYAAYGSPMVKFHTNPPAELKKKKDEVLNQSFTDQDITNKEITLQRNYGNEKFQMEGYSLIGYSTNPKAEIPDENITGEGITKDLYLRDGDKMPLSKEQVNKGLDLYAIWRPNHFVVVTNAWNPAELEGKTKDKTYIGLLCRPAVGTAGHEVVHQDAVYRPVKDSVQAVSSATPEKNTLEWKNLKSYDENGHRMSYIAVELTESTKKIFESGSYDYDKYGITIENKDIGDKIIQVKKQLVNTDGVDAMSAATERKHYNKEHAAVDVHQTKLGYFDTYGYFIALTNTKVDVQPPFIEDVEHGANKVVVKKVGDPSKLTITLPGGKKVILVKNAGGQLEKDPSTDFAGKVEITPEGVVTLTLPGSEQFTAGQKIQAFQTKKVGDKDANSTTTEKVVKAQEKSHEVVSFEQKPNDDDGNAVIEFTVPRHPILPPKKGSIYTLGYKEGGTFVPVADKYELDEDIISDNDTEKKATFTIPKAKFDEISNKDLIIKAEEPGKLPTDSKKVPVDTKAPTATAKAEDDLWRRWVNVDLEGLDDANHIVVVSYTDSEGQDHKLRFDTQEETEGTINMLERQGFDNYEISLEDRYGNSTEIKPDYDPTTVTEVLLRNPRPGKSFVQVKATDPDTTVTVRIYKNALAKEVLANVNYYDKVKSKELIAKAEKVVQQTIQPGKKYSVIKLEGYKLQKGDVVEIVGSTNTGANNRTNPLVYIVK